MKEKKAKYVFLSPQMITLIIGIFLIIGFIIIYITASIITKRIDFYSFFLRKIQSHIFLTILSGFHVSMLAVGILLILISFFKMSPNVYCYKDKFVIKSFLQKKIEINYDQVKQSPVQIYCLTSEKLFGNCQKKECRVFFNNPVFNFYLSYPVKGYFDDTIVSLKNKKDMTQRAIADRENIANILKMIKESHSFTIPFLPEQLLNDEKKKIL